MELGIPYVTHDHAFEEITDCDHYPARRGMYRKIGGGAETMIAVSTRMASDLARIVPGKSVRVVHTGADAPPIALSEVPRPRHLRNKTIVFSAAGFYRRKGVPLLIEAFARATSNNAHAVLRIAGDGADRPAVEQAITNSGISERIDLLGFISHAQVLQEMAWADVFALIGWDEPFATVFSEAMAAGSPIITAADGGITDVVCDGVHGRIVAPRDLVSAAEAVRELIENEDQRKRMGDAARTLFSTHLTWDGQACAALSILQDAAIVGRERNLTDSPRYGLGVVTSAHHRAADEQTGRKRH
jgi:glycosyltransferase involved in cell wall biosynthesis